MIELATLSTATFIFSPRDFSSAFFASSNSALVLVSRSSIAGFMPGYFAAYFCAFSSFVCQAFSMSSAEGGPHATMSAAKPRRNVTPQTRRPMEPDNNVDNQPIATSRGTC